MALRISSAEIVSSAMVWSPLPCRRWFGSGAGAGSAGQPPAGGLEAVGDAAVDDLVTDLDDQAAEDVGVDGDLQSDGAPVEAPEDVGQALLLRRGQRDGGGHAGAGLTATAAGRLGQPLDRDLRAADPAAGEHVAQQQLRDRVD